MTRRLTKAFLCAVLLAALLPGCSHIPRTDPDYARGASSATSASGPSSAASGAAASSASLSSTPASGSVPSAAEWQSALKGASLTLGSDGAAIILMAPKNAQKTLAKVSVWLQASRPYTGDVPQTTDDVIFNGNIGPASLSIDTAQKQTLTLQPAWYIVPSDKPVGGYETYETRYVTNVLQLKKDNQTSYLTCKPLYDWLKNDTWKTEFKPWQR